MARKRYTPGQFIGMLRETKVFAEDFWPEREIENRPLYIKSLYDPITQYTIRPASLRTVLSTQRLLGPLHTHFQLIDI